MHRIAERWNTNAVDVHARLMAAWQARRPKRAWKAGAPRCARGGAAGGQLRRRRRPEGVQRAARVQRARQLRAQQVQQPVRQVHAGRVCEGRGRHVSCLALL
jgi:hypothetical protein